MTNRTFGYSLLTLALAAALLLYLGTSTSIDLYLADRMFDFAKSEFPWRGRWFATVFMHEWVKAALTGFALLLMVVLAAERALSLDWFDVPMRRRLMVVVVSSVLVPLAVGLAKSRSIHACPWDLERYGGAAPYLRIFESLPEGVLPGRCFPAGHASSALWLAAFAVFLLPARPKTAVAAFIAGLAPGLCLGWVQQMRGAHFLTHTLWSAWLASLVMLLLARLLCPHPASDFLRILRVIRGQIRV